MPLSQIPSADEGYSSTNQQMHLIYCLSGKSPPTDFSFLICFFCFCFFFSKIILIEKQLFGFEEYGNPTAYTHVGLNGRVHSPLQLKIKVKDAEAWEMQNFHTSNFTMNF